MKLAPARLAAFGALLAVERGAWSSEALRAKSTHLDARDAGLASEICFGTLRRQGELDRVIEKLANRPAKELDPEVVIALEMALYQVRHLERVPAHAAVNDAVELVKRAGMQSAAPFVNAILRRSLRENVQVPTEAATPKWLLEGWTRQYGAAGTKRIVEASLTTPENYIRVGNGPPPEGAEPTDIAGCYRLVTGSPGEYRFQDISSQAVIPHLDLQPGQTLLDLCGAPGNKTAQAMEVNVIPITCDLHLSRAKMLLPLGIPVVVLDAAKPLPFSARFDRILVDAPCSGTGTLARNPEIKWRLRYDDISDLQDRQTAILRNAIDLLAPSGLLVYSTCSLERDENEDVVAAAINEGKAEVIRTMQRIPGQDEGDGFFAAVIRSTGRASGS